MPAGGADPSRSYIAKGSFDSFARPVPPCRFRENMVLLHRNVQRFRGGLVFKAHRLLYHSTLGLRVIKKSRRNVAHTRQTGPASGPGVQLKAPEIFDMVPSSLGADLSRAVVANASFDSVARPVQDSGF